MGIPGENIRKELVDLVTGLPVTLDALAKDSKSLEEAVGYYTAMVEFTLRGPPPTPCLPLLSYIMGVVPFTCSFHLRNKGVSNKRRTYFK